MGAPCAGIHWTALIGEPAQHRSWRNTPGGNPALVAPTALIEAYVVVSCGTFRPTEIGEHTWVMCGTHVGHDCVIGDDCEISANVTICGECTIGDRVKIGAGVTLRPRVTIGDGAQIGAGAVVVTGIPPGEVWVGNPARFLRVHEHGLCAAP